MSNSPSESSSTKKDDAEAKKEEKAAAAEQKKEDKDTRTAEEKHADPKSKDYDPNRDPDIPSSFVAGVVATELENGESPTLDGIKKAKKDAEKKAKKNEDS